MNGQPEIEVDYKKKYKNQKRKLKFLVYEQECFQEELRRAQRKLLKVSRDKSFLLDRLLQYENVDDDSSDSEATASSDNSDGEGQRATENPGVKKRRSSPHLSSVPPHSDTISLLPSAGYNALQSGTSGSYLSTVVPTPPTSAAVSFPVAAPPMPPRPFTSVPRQMLSGDAPEEESDGESDREEERGEGEEAELVIDIPNE
ncbi:INO80 complex subunit E isoform X4 [Erpetoichthys calabaricus]|uniref:INO80 complex subunit E isoform X4 n=1 Tax=Erpetoichthys calabaricus TaxID=27687 RepID=UPI00109F9D1C|nr:INO80 complex subunit E isoform X4 [Erpetoichthys calabaricus]XP_039625829.1 INO80 complex subunit E isoform X2 [Polypterus senegalus]